MASWLRHHGHDVVVLSGGHGPFEQMLADAGLHHRPLRSLGRALRPDRDAIAAWQLRAALRTWRPDVLSLHTAKAGALGRLVAPTLGLRPLYTPHGWSFAAGVEPTQASRYRAMERMLATLPSLIVNVCEHDRRLALEAGVGRAAQHVMVHNGMPERPGLPLARPAYQPVQVVMVARFEAQKDHATLVRALARLDLSTPWRLTLIGDGPLRAATEDLATQLGIRERVRFTGALLDVAHELARAQLFALTTHWEGFPRSVLEAMRAGLPVLASDVGGVREAVVDGRTGLATPPGDVAANSDALRHLLTRPELRARMGAAGRARYLEHFTLDRMARQTLLLYEGVARRRSASAVTPSISDTNRPV